ncbi:WAT1-related protein At3g30340-like [Chenopodium quinoa]|uniref:WAT1-related protein At3g30340-like n=1 Tax=Chenopodium quinoa TaxID=63459 RepID=UPI000B793195|nr:WAT1-related protein At3g30340-like [Chenopodium quinoa]
MDKKESINFQMVGCQKWKPVVVILIIYFVMAVLNLLFKKILDEGKSHLVIVTYRLTTAAIFLMPIAYFYERRKGLNVKLTPPILCYLFVSALIGATLTQYLFLLGIQCTSAAFATAFVNMTPVFTFLLAILLGQESVNFKSTGKIAKVLGSLICIGGVLLLILYRGIPLNKATYSRTSLYNANNLSMFGKIDSKHRWILGSIFLVLSILCWSGWFLLQSRIGKRYPCKYMSTALMSAFGAVQSAILCFAINRNISVWIFTGKLQIFTVLAAGVLGSGLCYVGISWCVEQRGPVFTSAFSPSIQIYIAIMDLSFFHEQIYLGSVIGSILIICGLYILLWGKSREASQENIIKLAEAVQCNESSATAIGIIHVTSSGCPS